MKKDIINTYFEIEFLVNIYEVLLILELSSKQPAGANNRLPSGEKLNRL